MRKFSVDINSFADVAPILPVGVYTGVLSGCSIMGKENKQYITIRKKVIWQNNTKVELDEMELGGVIMTGAILTDQKAKDILKIDEPKVFGMLNLSFNQEDGTMDISHNIALKQLIQLFDIDFNEIQESAEAGIDWDSLEIPEELRSYENIDTLYPAMIFHRECLNMLCTILNNQPVRVRIIHRATRSDKSSLEHAIDTGSRQAPFCGFLQSLE